MPRETDIPERIIKLLEDHQGVAFTSRGVASKLKTTPKTTRTHLLALFEGNRILRVYEYDRDGVGAYHYYAKPMMRKAAGR